MNSKSNFFIYMAAVLILIISTNLAGAEEPVITLKIPAHLTPGYEDVFPNMQAFVDRINELGKGRVKAELYHSEKLFKVKEIVPALMNGACEIIFHTSLHTTETWPEIGALSLPYLYRNEKECRSQWSVGSPAFELVNKEMDRKYGVRILASGIMKGGLLATRQTAPLTPEDFKGLKVRTAGKSDTEFIKACGGLSIFLRSSQVKEALKLGMLDGISTYPVTIIARDLADSLDYLIEADYMFFSWGYQIYMLNKTFNSWPKEVQDIITQAANEYDQGILKTSAEYYSKNVLPILQEKMKFVKPSPDQMEKLVKTARGTDAEWAKSVDAEFAKKFLELIN